jgi:DNA modification methylase
MQVNKIYTGDCLEWLRQMPDNFIDCCVTSPPYYGLRDYGTAQWSGGDSGCDHKGIPLASNKSTLAGYTSEDVKVRTFTVPFKDTCLKCGATRIDNQIGLEETPTAYVSKLVEVFREVKRVLKKEGTLWLNLGDSYNGSGGAGGDYNEGGLREGQPKYNGRKISGLKPKDLIGIPWMVAFALRADGWYLRQDIIWAKPNPMPESVTDRCTKSHEYIFLLSKSQKYYYDAEAIKVDSVIKSLDEAIKRAGHGGAQYDKWEDKNGFRGKGGLGRDTKTFTGYANKRSVWTVTTKPFAAAHFATFPEDLISDCIKAGCPEFVCNKCGKARERIIEKEYKKHDNWFGDKQNVRHSRGNAGNSYNELISTKPNGLTDCNCNEGFSPGIVLDPFSGAGTTPVVARKLNRNYIGIELNETYVSMAKKRLYNEIGLFL